MSDETKSKTTLLHGWCRDAHVGGFITLFEMNLLNDIVNMSNGERGCYASAAYFAERWNRKSQSIRLAMASLKRLKFILRKHKNGKSFLVGNEPKRLKKINTACREKSTQPVEKNQHPSHTTYGNRKKKKMAAPTEAGASTLLKFSEDDKTNANQERTSADKFVDAYLEFAIEDRLFTISKRRKPAIQKWKAAAEELIESNPIKRIRQVMKWYAAEYKDNEWLPVCKSLPTFADKFLNIEKAMVRQHPDRKRSASKRAGKSSTMTLPDGKRITIA